MVAMKRPYFVVETLFVLLSLLVPVLPARAFDFNPNFVISDAEMVDTESMSEAEIAAFLNAYGTLDGRTFEDVDGTTRRPSTIVSSAARRNGISPRVILVMLQKEQSLVTDTTPTDDQLDWALGYGICDNCNHNSAAAQRFRGFAKQINSATLQLSQGYLADLASAGETVMGFGPGITATIDDVDVTPSNNATAALYTYTPHTHGNLMFATLWQAWFTHEYPDGSLLQNTDDGAVWLIQYGRRRPITTRAALLTRFNETQIIPVSATSLNVFPTGKAISLPNYSLLRSPRGTVYLLVDDTLRGIASQEAFRAIGFVSDEIMDVSFEDLAAYEEGDPITTDTVYPQGALLQDTTTGGVYFVQDGTKRPIMSREILTARFSTMQVRPAEDGELDAYPTGNPVTFPDGTLIAVSGDPAVFVVSEGKRRPILDESTFLTFGWKWEQVVYTNQKSLDVEPIGDPISSLSQPETTGDETQTL